MEDKSKTIYTSARKLFAENGFKATNISAVMKDAGMAVGTFYNYYSSKEELFLKIFIDENMELKRGMFSQIDTNDDLVTLAAKMMTQYVKVVNSNRILGEWYNKELFSKLEKYFDKENGVRSIEEFMNNDIAMLIKQWKAEGKLRDDIDDGMIQAILYSVVFVDMHKTEIGIEYFPDIITRLFEFIMKGLTEKR